MGWPPAGRWRGVRERTRHAHGLTGACERLSLCTFARCAPLLAQGLADVAKQAGALVRAFQPTLRELQEISADVKDTLDNEIGLDELKRDIDSITQPLANPLAPPPPRPKAPAAPAPPAAPAAAAPEAPAAPATQDAAPEGGAETAAGAAQDTVTDEMIAASKAAAWGGQAPEASAAAPVAPAEAPTPAPAEAPAAPEAASAAPAQPPAEAESNKP